MGPTSSTAGFEVQVPPTLLPSIRVSRQKFEWLLHCGFHVTYTSFHVTYTSFHALSVLLEENKMASQ
jgi:hypothetical protein